MDDISASPEANPEEKMEKIATVIWITIRKLTSGLIAM
jgi:hypothetical protein